MNFSIKVINDGFIKYLSKDFENTNIDLHFENNFKFWKINIFIKYTIDKILYDSSSTYLNLINLFFIIFSGFLLIIFLLYSL